MGQISKTNNLWDKYQKQVSYGTIIKNYKSIKIQFICILTQ